jgi:hypothetical protein
MEDEVLLVVDFEWTEKGDLFQELGGGYFC